MASQVGGLGDYLLDRDRVRRSGGDTEPCAQACRGDVEGAREGVDADRRFGTVTQQASDAANVGELEVAANNAGGGERTANYGGDGNDADIGGGCACRLGETDAGGIGR